MQTRTNTKLKSDAPARDVAGLAEERRRRGLALALRMFRAGERRSSKRARLRAVLLGRCSDRDNLWTAEGFEGKDGREFDAVGVKSACASRLCPHCLKLIQSRAQKRLVAARDEFWKDRPLERGKFERFITLTSPTLAGASQEETDKIYNRAWAALTHTDFWKDRVDAGAKHVEFTVNRQGFHTHAHALTYGRFIERDAAKEEETREQREEWKATRERKMREAEALGLRIVADNAKPLPELGNLQDEWTKCITRSAKWSGHIIEWRANYVEDYFVNEKGEVFGAHILGPNCKLRFHRNGEKKGQIMRARDGSTLPGAHVVPAVKVGWYSRWPLQCSGGAVIECHPTSAAKARVDVRMVREKGRAGKGEIGITDAVKELTKYLVKSPTWDDVPDEQLIEIAEVKRWPRCFELFGGYREAGQKLGKKPAPAVPFIEVMDGETWPQFYARACEVEREIRERTGDETFTIGDDCFTLARETIEARDARAARSAAAAAGGEDASLDTDCINRIGEGRNSGARDEDRGPPRAGPSLPTVIRLWFDVLYRAWPSEGLHVWAACVVLLFLYEPTRALPLMEIGEAVEFDVWLVIVGLRLVRARRSRMQQLARRHPDQVFKCLDGSEFYGENWRRLRHIKEGRLRQSAEWSAFATESRERNRAEFIELVAQAENHAWWKWVNEPAGDDDWKREIRKMVWDRFKASSV